MGQIGISKLDLKRQNRMQILKLLKKKGPISRVDIANTLELTRAAVTIITNEMIDQHIISEIGEYKSEESKATRGRKKILIDINQNYKFIVGITIEAKIISIGLCTLNGAILDKCNKETTEFSCVDDIFDFIRIAYKEMLENSCLSESKILGVGIGIMPNMYSYLGVNYNSKTPDYTNIINYIRKFTQLPLNIDNCVKGTSMANIDFQKSKDPNRENIGFLSFDNSFNYIITNLNEPVHSYDNRTSFVNNIVINPFTNFSPEGNLIKGSAIAELCTKSLFKKIKSIYGKNSTPYLYELTNGNPSNIKFKMCQEAIINGDDKVNTFYEEFIHLIAVFINNIFYATNPQKLVLHNFTVNEKYISDLRKQLAIVSDNKIVERVSLSIIDEKNHFLGGAALAVRELFYTAGGII